jgi:hypothetical protein
LPLVDLATSSWLSFGEEDDGESVVLALSSWLSFGEEDGRGREEVEEEEREEDMFVVGCCWLVGGLLEGGKEGEVNRCVTGYY